MLTVWMTVTSSLATMRVRVAKTALYHLLVDYVMLERSIYSERVSVVSYHVWGT